MTGNIALHCCSEPQLRFVLKRTTCVLGRSSRCDFVVDHGSVSRRHAELSAGESGVSLRDLGSTNGTFVDDERVHVSVVHPGQIIHFGEVAITVEQRIGDRDIP
jgi:pSer/pThr/pTyr-binding forkhead associated (FHA) protein